MEIKHRHSQAQLQVMAPWCWDAECRSWGRSWVGHSCCSGWVLPLYQLTPKTKAQRYFHFSPFLVKQKFSVSKNRYWCRTFCKVKCIKWTSSEIRGELYLPDSCRLWTMWALGYRGSSHINHISKQLNTYGNTTPTKAYTDWCSRPTPWCD